jgi:hypothetical protein
MGGICFFDAKKPGTSRALCATSLSRSRRHKIKYVGDDTRRGVVSNHIAPVVPILITRRWRRLTHPIRLWHRLNDILSRNHAACHKHRTLAAPPPIGIAPVVRIKPPTIFIMKVVVLAILLRLPGRHVFVTVLLRLSRRHMVIIVIVLLRLPRRYAAMPGRRIVRIVPWGTLCNAYARGQ